jgi:hypothetical protein
MGPFGIVLDPPRFDDLPRLLQRREPVLIQAFRPEMPVETLDVRIVRRLAGPGEFELHAVLVRPSVECLGDELRPVVHR